MNIDLKKTDFTKVEIGTEVYCLMHGIGWIYKTNHCYPYVIEVEFKDEDNQFYTQYGYYYLGNKIPMLYLINQKFTIEINDLMK